MKLFNFLIVLFSSISFGALNDVDKAYLSSLNILKNPGFENGKQNWTASAGSFSHVTSGSNLLIGLGSVTWDAAASADTLSHSAIAIPNGLKGKNGVGYCSIMTPSGSAIHSLQVYDGTNILSSDSIYSNTNPQRTYVTFIFPTSGNITLRLYANANEPSVTIDDCYLGTSNGIALSQFKPQDVFSALVSNTGTVTSENVDFINGNCTNADPRVCTFNGGIFSVAPNCTTDNAAITAVSSSSVSIDQNGTQSYIICQKASVDSPSVAYKSDTFANSWSGYHDNTCVWSRTNTAVGAFTDDASCALVELYNRNFGTVSTSGSVSPAITFTPKRSGRYFICAAVKISGGTANSGLTETLTDGSTIINDASLTTANINMTYPHALCGIVNAASTSSITLTIQGSASAGAIKIDSSPGVANNSRSSIEWSIVALDQVIPAPVIVSPRSARAYASATSITGALATIVWTTEDFDADGALSSGVYTCVDSGKYQVNASLALSGTFILNNTTIIEIQKNGTAIANVTHYIAAAITNESIQISDVLSCAAGDTIRIQASNSGTTPAIVSSNTKNFLSIVKVGN